MLRTMTITLLGLVLAGALAARDLELVEGAYEVALDDVALPSSAAGNAVFRPCEDCETVALRVTSATRYFVGGQTLPLPDFLLAVEPLQDRDDAATLTVVYYDLETRQVTRIAVFPPRA